MKTCTKCGLVKSLSEFYRDSKRKTGHFPHCKLCVRSAASIWWKANRQRVRLRNSEWVKANPNRVLAYRAKWRKNNPEKDQAWRKANPEKARAISAKYRKANPEKTRMRVARYWEANPGRRIASVVKRQASKLMAIPKWNNEFFVKEAYQLASLRTKNLGYKWHVDHIVPLRSSLVCGLHVHNNLRVIPAAANQSKGNRSWPDMP